MMLKNVCIIFIAIFFMTSHTSQSYSQSQVVNVDSTLNITFNHLYAVMENGSLFSQGNDKCKKLYSSILGSTMNIYYKIDTKTLIMYSVATYMKKHIHLFPLGLSDKFDFMSNNIPTNLLDKGIIQIVFEVLSDFSSHSANMLLKGSDTSFNCVISHKNSYIKTS